MKAPASSFKSFWKKAYGKGGDENVMVSANTQTDIHTYKKVKNNPPPKKSTFLSVEIN